jgi:hypothetical protein
MTQSGREEIICAIEYIPSVWPPSSITVMVSVLHILLLESTKYRACGLRRAISIGPLGVSRLFSTVMHAAYYAR